MRCRPFLLVAVVLGGCATPADADEEDRILASLDGPLTQARLTIIQDFAARDDAGSALPEILAWMEKRAPSRDIVGGLLVKQIVRSHPGSAPAPEDLAPLLTRRNADSARAGLSALRVVLDAGRRDLSPRLAEALVLLTTSQRPVLFEGAVGCLRTMSGTKVPSQPKAWAEWFSETFDRRVDLNRGPFEILAFVEPSPDSSGYLINGEQVRDLDAVRSRIRALATEAKQRNIPLSVEVSGSETPSTELPEEVKTLASAAASVAGGPNVTVVFQRRRVRSFSGIEPPPFERFAGLQYGERMDSSLRLDAFLPRGRKRELAVVWVESSDWVSSPDSLEAGIPYWVKPFVTEGYAVFGVLHGGGRVEEMAADIGNALSYLKRSRDRFGIRRFVLLGHSSGGHLALIAGLRSSDKVRKSLAGIIAIAAPTDLRAFLSGPVPEGVRKAFVGPGDPTAEEAEAIAERLSPITYVQAGMPPVLLVTGTDDEVVPSDQARRFVKSARAVGAGCELLDVEGHTHVWKGLEGAATRVVSWLAERDESTAR